jgi:predicted nuclease with TOPRIM domain
MQMSEHDPRLDIGRAALIAQIDAAGDWNLLFAALQHATTEMEHLSTDNERLRNEIARLNAENDRLQDRIERLKAAP